MTEILITTWAAIIGVLSGAWSIVEEVLVWGWSVLYHLHVDAPRLEGLLIGVLLTWVLLRRDKHPLLRVLSAPLKLVVDILDLAWDQVVEVLTDSKDAVYSWVKKLVDFVVSRVKGSWSWTLAKLQSLKDRLSKKREEGTED